MVRRITGLFAAVVLLLCSCIAGNAATVDVAAPSYLLMDAATGTILLEENSHEQLAPASVTKVMTLLLTMEALDSGRIQWDDSVTASAAAAAKGGSQIYLEEGEQLPLREMLKSVVVSSANDCATALAEHVAGSESAFVERMNQRAQELGMTDTLFANCTGLDDEANAEQHHSSAHDIAIMSRELLKHDAIREYTTIWMDTVRGGQFGLSNTNKLIRFYKGATGLKTGFTTAAGYCLSGTAEREGMELIAVVMHCASSADRFSSAKALLDYGFANYCLASPLPEEPIQAIPIRLGEEKSIVPVPASEDPLLLKKGQQITRSITLEESVEAPVEAGQQLGLIRIQCDEETLCEIPLIAQEAVARLKFSSIWLDVLRSACLGSQSA